MSVVRKIMVVMVLLSLAALTGEAQTVSVGQTNSQSMRQLLRRIEDRIDLLRNSVNTRSSVYDNRENVSVLLSDFQNAVRQLRQNVNRRAGTSADAQLVLDRGRDLDSIFRQRRVDAQTQRYWANVRTDLNELARAYGLAWSNSPVTNNPYPGYGIARLRGTYRLNSSLSDDPSTTIERALRSLPYQQRQQRRDQLLRRLESPDQIAIDVSGRNVTLVSTRAPQITFDADGRERIETMPNGRTIRVRTAMTG